MNEQELRGLIRDSIARHLGPAPRAASAPALSADGGSFQAHGSHARFVLVRSADDDGACLIEPAVRCNHCGYCQSLGH